MATGVNSNYDAAEAARIRAEEEARKRAEEERRRKAEEEKKAKEAQQARETEEKERAQQERQEEQTTGSVFGSTDDNSGLKTQEVGNYDEWVQSLHSRGLKTTKIHANKGEANFQDYGNALSTELQQEILNSFDNEQDYELQSQLASIFSSDNYYTFAEIRKACAKLGINVERQSVKTQYLQDNKSHGYNKANTRVGHISVFTFSDGKGGEIKIADTNGNGALETEELFVNEILTGIASDLKVSSGGVSGIKGSGSSGAKGLSGAKNAQGILKNIFDNNSGKSFSDLIKELEEFKAQLKEEREEKEKEQKLQKDKTQVTSATFDTLVREQTNDYMENDMLQYSIAYQKALDEVSEKYYVI